MTNPTAEGNTSHTLGFVLAGLGVGLVAVFSIWCAIWVLIFSAAGYGVAVLAHILFAPVEELGEQVPLRWRLAGVIAGLVFFVLILLLHWKLLIVLICVLAAYILSKLV